MCRLHLLEEIDALALTERDVGLLPIGTAPKALPNAAHLAEDVAGSHLQDLHLEEALDGALDLDLVGVVADLEHDLVADLVDEGALLGDERRRDDFVLAF